MAARLELDLFGSEGYGDRDVARRYGARDALKEYGLAVPRHPSYFERAREYVGRKIATGLVGLAVLATACGPVVSGTPRTQTPTYSPSPTVLVTPSATSVPISPSPSRTPIPTPIPVPGCDTIPDVPYTIERDTDVKIIVPDGVDNKETSCLYDDIKITGNYAFVRWTVDSIENGLKPIPKYYSLFKNFVKSIDQTELPSYGQAGNTAWGRGILVANRGAFGVVPRTKLLNMIRYAGTIVHEVKQIMMAVEDHSVVNDIKNLVINGDETQIEFYQDVRKKSDVPGISDLISIKEQEIVDCRNGKTPACNQ